MTCNNRTRVFLLPGLHGTGDLFDSFVKQRPPGFDPITVSYPRDRALSYEALACEVQSQITGGFPTVLIGESFSGPVALRLSSERPLGVIAVVLVASFVLPPAPSWLRFLPWQSLFHARIPLCKLRAIVAGSRDEKEILVKAGSIIRDVSANVLASRVRSALTVDARSWLGSCPVPLLYLAGARDCLVRPHSLASILECRPDVVCRTMQTSHFVLQLAPTQAWNAIVEFIREKT